MKILIADDDPDVADVIKIGLEINWPESKILLAADGEQALKLFSQEDPDLVILDIGMPSPNGFEVCKLIREQSDVPIIIVSGNTSTIEKVHALDVGADDYITKPFDQFELLARLRAIARRPRLSKLALSTRAHPQVANIDAPLNAKIKVGNVTLFPTLRQVYVGDKAVSLTSTECRLLEELMQQPGRVLSYNTLLERIWGSEYVGENKYLKAFVWRLRKKLTGRSTISPYIQNEWGRGYMFIDHPR